MELASKWKHILNILLLLQVSVALKLFLGYEVSYDSVCLCSNKQGLLYKQIRSSDVVVVASEREIGHVKMLHKSPIKIAGPKFKLFKKQFLLCKCIHCEKGCGC